MRSRKNSSFSLRTSYIRGVHSRCLQISLGETLPAILNMTYTLG